MTKDQTVYRVTTEPLAAKLNMRGVVRRVLPEATEPQIREAEKLAEETARRLTHRIDEVIEPEGVQILPNDPYQKRRERTTEMVRSAVERGLGVVVMDTTHVDTDKLQDLPVEPFDENRLYDANGSRMGLGPRPTDSRPSGSIPLTEQADRIGGRMRERGKRSVAAVDDIVDSGTSITDLRQRMNEQGLEVSELLLSGSIYPARREALQNGELRGVQIDAAMPPLPESTRVKGGFNLADAVVGGPGNTVGESTGTALRPKIVGERTDGTPMPTGLLYGTPGTEQAFLRDARPSTQRETLGIVLEESERLWTEVSDTLGRPVPVGALERFPSGLGVEPNKETLAKPVTEVIGERRRRLQKR